MPLAGLSIWPNSQISAGAGQRALCTDGGKGRSRKGERRRCLSWEMFRVGMQLKKSFVPPSALNLCQPYTLSPKFSFFQVSGSDLFLPPRKNEEIELCVVG